MDPLAHEDLEGAPSTSGPRVRSAALLKAGERALPPVSARADADATARRRKRTWLALLAVVGISSGIATGNALGVRHNASAAVRAERAWHGRVTRIARSGADASGGVEGVWPNGRRAPLAEGSEV